MTAPDPTWRRVFIPALGATIAIDPAWPLETLPLPGGEVLSQRLSDAAAAFLRYGPEQTIERFLAGLGDARTRVTVLADVPAEIAGTSGRQVTVRLERAPAVGSAERAPLVLRVTGLVVRGVPVLIGRREPADASAETLTELAGIVERFVASVT